ncbi:hypothetical protein JCM10212_005788 [Sporobolomyces blumeae]
MSVVESAQQVARPTNDDRTAVLTHSALKGVQTVSLIAPPVLVLSSLYRRSFRLSHLFRNLTLSTAVVGPAVGVGLASYRMVGMDAAEVKEKAVRVKANRKQRRCDDYSVIGGVLGALGTTTVFLKRARLPWVVGAGASLGIAGGVIYHTVLDVREGESLEPVKNIEGAVGAKPTG